MSWEFKAGTEKKPFMSVYVCVCPDVFMQLAQFKAARRVSGHTGLEKLLWPPKDLETQLCIVTGLSVFLSLFLSLSHTHICCVIPTPG